MSDSELFASSSQGKPSLKKPRNPFVGLTIALSLTIIGGIVGKACGRWIAKLSGPSRGSQVAAPRTSANELPSDRAEAIWKTYSPEGIEMSLELPGEPTRLNREMPAELKNIVISVEGYQLKQTGLEVVATHFKYVPMNIVINAERSAREYLQGIWTSPGVSDFQSSINNTSPSETKFSATYVREHIRYKAVGFARTADFKLWGVTCVVETGNADAELAAKRVLNSIVIK